jgi:hypothetical protein
MLAERLAVMRVLPMVAMMVNLMVAQSAAKLVVLSVATKGQMMAGKLVVKLELPSVAQ